MTVYNCLQAPYLHLGPDHLFMEDLNICKDDDDFILLGRSFQSTDPICLKDFKPWFEVLLWHISARELFLRLYVFSLISINVFI